jgi:nucleoside-diphosphate-sugar epimerase
MSDRVLVTGGTGFFGTHLVAALRANGREVVALSSADGDVVRCVLPLDGVGQVVHLAGRSFVPDSWLQPRDFYEVNVLGTINVLDHCRRAAVPLIHVSSYVYGVPQTLPIAEDHPLQPFNPYSHTKILAEDAVPYYTRQIDQRTAVVRPFNVYGSGQDERFLLPTIIRQALDASGDAITVQDLRPRRDYIHVRDLVALLIAVMTRRGKGVFNAGSGQSIAVGEVVDAVNAAVGGSKPVRATGAARRDEVFEVVADISRARRELGWEPRMTLRDGIGEAVEWTRAQTAALR